MMAAATAVPIFIPLLSPTACKHIFFACLHQHRVAVMLVIIDMLTAFMPSTTVLEKRFLVQHNQHHRKADEGIHIQKVNTQVQATAGEENGEILQRPGAKVKPVGQWIQDHSVFDHDRL